MANSNLKTLSDIFNNKIFRIPDYQRGYSWGKSQLEDLWRDIDNLPLNKSHYTGMITVDIKDNNIYHVIDGQQRLTTLIIFIKNILDNYEEEWITEDIEKLFAIKKYLYTKTKNSKNSKIIFSYYENNSSYYYYKTKILNIEDKTNSNTETTLYTENLNFANEFFQNKLKDKTQNELEELFIKITTQLKFNWYEIEKTDDLDEYIIFETMNNRGKPLSVLEILKNRLIYLVTLLDNENDDKNKLRNDINEVWKTIFEYLGKDKKMDEDWFLKYHTAMYFGTDINISVRNYLLDDIFNIRKIYDFNFKKEKYNKTINSLTKIKKNIEKIKNIKHKDLKKNINYLDEIWNESKKINSQFVSKEPLICCHFYALDINNDIYIEKYEENIEDIIYDKQQFIWFLEELLVEIKDLEEDLYLQFIPYEVIEDYVSSLKISIMNYFNILNNNFENNINYWLYKINIIDSYTLMPLLLSLFNNIEDIEKNKFINLLKNIEEFLFIKSFTSYIVKGKINELNLIAYTYNKYKNTTYLQNINTCKVNTGSNKKIFDSKKFIKYIKDLFDSNDKYGFYSWSGLKYVLYEYELYLKEQFKSSDKKIHWKEINRDSIEHILPQNITYWEDFKNMDEVKLKKYTHSIGNLLLLSKHRNSKASNKPFKDKKEIYSSGSFNEIEVSKYEKWTTREINERSEKILDFMNKRWHLGLKIADVNKLK
jgi:uncharacterized protein with ParB-like and HNH nuclease domain